MIDIIKQTPEEYSLQSRDYQVLARLYTAVFNYSKMYIDNLSIWDSNIDNKLVTLRAKTLNFDIKHSWDLDELEAVTSCFKYLMRTKGTVTSIKYCINILLRVLGLSSQLQNENITIDTDTYNITIKADVTNLTSGIIEDLLAYLLPTGWNFRVIQYSSYSSGSDAFTEMKHSDDVIRTTSFEDSYKQYIGNNTNKKRFITHTWIYDNNESAEDSNESDTDDMEI